MNLYVLVNLGVIALPLLLSFDRRVAFFRRWPALLGALCVVSPVYIAWDVLVTARGDWWFNIEFAGDPVLFGLPLGEVLFFVTVPYACVFIYEVVRAYFPEYTARSMVRVLAATFSVVMILIGLAAVFREQQYTLLALLSAAAVLALVALLDRPMLTSSHTWLFLVLSYLPFLAVNGVLTSLPVVGYNPEAIWGVRAFSIPLEDFFYNFGMLAAYLLVFRSMKTILHRLAGGAV